MLRLPRPRLHLLARLVAAVSMPIAGCSSEPDAAAPALADADVTGELPCDVATTLASRCGSCHGAKPAFGAPMSLVTLADLHRPAVTAPGRRVRELLVERIASDARPMPPPPNARLTDDERRVLTDWATRGATSGAACAATAPTEGPAAKPLSCAVDLRIRPKARAVIPSDKADQYVCYGFERKVDKKRHVIGLAPHVDNLAHVHHLLLFQTPEAMPGEPFPCSVSASPAWKLVAGWAPGVGALELPPAAGFPEEGTTHWAMQVHYNNAAGAEGQSDESGFDLCTTDQLRRYDADMLATGGLEFAIPPRARHELSCQYAWGAGPSGSHADGHPDIRIFSVFPHMHKLGRHMSVEKLTPGNNKPLPIMAPQPFDFESQYNRPADTLVERGDVIRTRCTWENTTDQRVIMGEGTADEMCFAFLMYYPRVESRDWSWSTPSGSLGTVCEEYAPR